MTRAGVVVVGASVPGPHTALTLRRLGYEDPVTVIGAEPHLPYERPELSKGFLAGDVGVDQLLVTTAQEYQEQGINLLLGTAAVALDVERRRVVLDDDAVPYDTAVIATGSLNLRPPIPGIDLPGVLQLRTLEDAAALAAAATGASRAVVVGMGLVGCEITATLRGLGLEVAAVDGLPGPLWAALGPELSAMVRQWHEQRGVEVISGVGVAAIEGGASVEGVVLANGRRIAADLVVVGVGATGCVHWLHGSALHLAAGGVGVDALLRASADNVYAAGDVAAVWSPANARHTRTEHYLSALGQASQVAHQIVGQRAPDSGPTWFWSFQYGHHLQFAGQQEPDDVMVVRPDPFAAFFLRDGVLTAAATVDNGRDLRRALPLLGHQVDTRALADADVDLRLAVRG